MHSQTKACGKLKSVESNGDETSTGVPSESSGFTPRSADRVEPGGVCNVLVDMQGVRQDAEVNTGTCGTHQSPMDTSLRDVGALSKELEESAGTDKVLVKKQGPPQSC